MKQIDEVLYKRRREADESKVDGRVDLDRELNRLQETIRIMADKIEKEVQLREKIEKNYEKLLNDLIEDVKYPVESFYQWGMLFQGLDRLDERSRSAQINALAQLVDMQRIVHSNKTAIKIRNTLIRSMSNTFWKLKDGRYSTKMNLDLEEELRGMQGIFDEMETKIVQEINLRKQSEENRKKLILHIAHDLKNPLASIQGYAEMCIENPDLPEEKRNRYLKIIFENSIRANKLMTELFELSKLESPEFTLHAKKADICEYLRLIMGTLVLVLEDAKMEYFFDIPEKEIYCMIDEKLMNRVFYNLTDNLVQHNERGTMLLVGLTEQEKTVTITFRDNGVGLPDDIIHSIFKPFGGTMEHDSKRLLYSGLGLSIVHRIITLHRGDIRLNTHVNSGCTFEITLDKEELI